MLFPEPEGPMIAMRSPCLTSQVTGCNAVERIPPELSGAYGMVKVERGTGRLHNIEDLVEKPKPDEAPSDLAIIGRYILTPEIFEHIERTAPDAKGEIQLTNALRSLLGEQPIRAFEFGRSTDDRAPRTH